MGNAVEGNSRPLDTRDFASSNNHDVVRDVPLTPDKVVEVLMKVKRKNKRLSKRRMIPEILKISDFKSNQLIQGCKCDEMRLKRLVEFWLSRCPYASWRWIIWHLDLIECHDIVDQIAHYAEPLNDPSLTYANVLKIFQSCKISKFTLNDSLGVSQGDLFGIKRKISRQTKNDEEYREALISWWLLTSPFASWECLAESLALGNDGHIHYPQMSDNLNQRRMKSAFHLAAKHVKHFPDSTLTSANLYSALDKSHRTRNGRGYARYTSNCVEISYGIYKDDFIRYCLHCYPSPSWKAIAHLLYCAHEYDVLEFIYKEYIKESRSTLCDTPEHSEITDVSSDAVTECKPVITQHLSVDNVVNLLLQHVKFPLNPDDKHPLICDGARTHSRYVGHHILSLSPTTVDVILSTCTFDEHQQLEKLVCFWLTRCPLASWRWLMWRFEVQRHIKAARVIQEYAEPLADHTLCFESVAAVFKDVTLHTVNEVLEVPAYRKEQITSVDQAIEWWLSYSPFAGWDFLNMSVITLDRRYHSIEPVVRSRLPALCVPPSLISYSLLESALKDIPEDNCYRTPLYLFIIPKTSVEGIEQQYPHLSRKQAILQSYIDTYSSSLSWKWIMHMIYQHMSCDTNEKWYNLYASIELIQEYNKGITLQGLCVKAVSNSIEAVEDVETLILPKKFKILIELATIHR